MDNSSTLNSPSRFVSVVGNVARSSSHLKISVPRFNIYICTRFNIYICTVNYLTIDINLKTVSSGKAVVRSE